MGYQAATIHRECGVEDLLRYVKRDRRDVSPTVDSRVLKLREFIDRNAGNLTWNWAHICRELKLEISAAYAARIFKRVVGVGAREYANKQRLLAAAERLSSTNLSVKVIAAECGYRAPCDFARRFKQEYNLSPTQFRKRVA